MSQKTDVVGAAAAEPHSQPAHARYRRTTQHDSVPAEDDDDSNDDVNPQLCQKASASALPRTIRVHDDKNTALLEDAELPSSQTRLSFQAVEDDFPEFAISQRELFFFLFLAANQLAVESDYMREERWKSLRVAGERTHSC